MTGKVQLITDDGHRCELRAAGQAPAQRAACSYIYTVDQSPIIRNIILISLFPATPQGNLQLLSYDEGDTDMGGGVIWSSLLKEERLWMPEIIFW